MRLRRAARLRGCGHNECLAQASAEHAGDRRAEPEDIDDDTERPCWLLQERGHEGNVYSRLESEA